MRKLKQGELRRYRKTSEKRHRGKRRTPQSSSSATCGCVPHWRAIAVITVAALVAAGQVAQVPYHLNRAMDSGLTRDEASEVLTHMAFYSGWPTIFSALPVFKDVFAGRKN